MDSPKDIAFIKIEPKFYLDDNDIKPLEETWPNEEYSHIPQAYFEPKVKLESVSEADSSLDLSHIETQAYDPQQNKPIKSNVNFTELHRTGKTEHRTEKHETRAHNNTILKQPQKTGGQSKKKTNKNESEKQKNKISPETVKCLECCVCSRKFNTAALIKTHTRHESFHMRCLICNTDYTDPEKLYIDVTSHRLFTCENCGNSYGTKGNLFYHKKKCGINAKSPICEMLCTICGKGFDRKSLFRQHMMFHEDIRPFPCTFCKKSFRNRFHLKAHERIHLDIKPYACDECSKSFVTISALKNHKNNHNIPGYKGHITHKSPHNIVKVAMHNNHESNLDYTKDRNFTKNSLHVDNLKKSSVKFKDADYNQGSVADRINNKNSENSRKQDLIEENIKIIQTKDSKVDLVHTNEPNIDIADLHNKVEVTICSQTFDFGQHSRAKFSNPDVIQEDDGIENENDEICDNLDKIQGDIEQFIQDKNNDGMNNDKYKSVNNVDTIKGDLKQFTEDRSNDGIINDIYENCNNVGNYQIFTKQFQQIVDENSKQIKVEVSEKPLHHSYQQSPTKIFTINKLTSDLETLDDTLSNKLFKKELDKPSITNMLKIEADTENEVKEKFIKVEIQMTVEEETTIIGEVKEEHKETPLIQKHIIKNDIKNLVKCCICQDEFKNAKPLKKHKHNTFEMLCLECNRTYTELKDLKSHIDFHLEKKAATRNICGKSLKKKSSLISHGKESDKINTKIQINTDEINVIQPLEINSNNEDDVKKMAKCCICHKQFKNALRLKKHKHSTFNMLCLICNTAYTELKEFQNHINKHMTENPTVICNMCQSSFRTKPALVCHLKKCGNVAESLSSSALQSVKKHLCIICGKKFGTKHGMVEHMMYHEDVRPFPCNYCPKKFRNKVRLKEHESIHLGTKPHMCDICGKCFITSTELKKHTAKHDKPGYKIHYSHKSPVKHTHCPVCDVAVSSLRQHSNEHYTKVDLNFHCNICNKEVKDKTKYGHFIMHIKAGFHKCDICGKGYNGRERMLSHKKLHAIVASKRTYKKRIPAN